MTKSATIDSRVRLNNVPRPAVAKSQFSTNAKIIIGVGAVILVLGGVIIAAMPEPGVSKPPTIESRSTRAASSTGMLTALTTKFNFGSVSMAAGKVTHRYSIRNTGTEPVLIRKMYTSCMCTTAALVRSGRKSVPYGMPGHGPMPTINESIDPGEAAMIEVVFDPAAHGPAGIGPVDRIVTIESSAGQALELTFAANVTP